MTRHRNRRNACAPITVTAPLSPSKLKEQRIKQINGNLKSLMPRRIPTMLGFGLIDKIPCALVGHQRSRIKYNIGASKYGDKTNLGRPAQNCMQTTADNTKRFGCHTYLTDGIPRHLLYADPRIGPLLLERDRLWGFTTSARNSPAATDIPAVPTVPNSPAVPAPNQSPVLLRRPICPLPRRSKPLTRHESLLFVSPGGDIANITDTTTSVTPWSPAHRNASPPSIPASPTNPRSRSYSVDSDGFPTPLSIIGRNKRKREGEIGVSESGPFPKKVKLTGTDLPLAKAERAAATLPRSLFLDLTRPLSGIVWAEKRRDPKVFCLYPRENGFIYLSDFKLHLGVFGVEFYDKLERRTAIGWISTEWNEPICISGTQLLLRLPGIDTSLWVSNRPE